MAAPNRQIPSPKIALAHFLHQIESHHVRTPNHRPAPLHWDYTTQALKEFAWYAASNFIKKNDDENLTRDFCIPSSGPVTHFPKSVSLQASWNHTGERITSEDPAAFAPSLMGSTIRKHASE